MSSKIGIGIHEIPGSRYSKFITFMAEAKPAVILTLTANKPWLLEALNVSPQTKVIQRKYVGSQPLSNSKGEAKDHASALAASSIYEVVAANDGFWVGYNEIAGHQREQRLNLNEFDYWMATYARGYGVKYLCGSWSVGRPHVDLDSDNPMYEWEDVYPSMRESDGLSLHQYNAPSVWDERDFDRGWWWRILRHQLAYNFFPDDLKTLPLYITEGIIDSGASGGPGGWDAGGQGGWKSFMSPQEHLDQIEWMDDKLKLDDYVKGLTLFGWATADPTWDTFDPSRPPEMFQLLMSYLKAQNSVVDIDDPIFVQWLSDEAQKHVIPMNQQTYFRTVRAENGWDEAMSDEFYPVPGVVAQVFYSAATNSQHIIYAKIPNYADYRVIQRDN